MKPEETKMLVETHTNMEHIMEHLDKGEKNFEKIYEKFEKMDTRMDGQDKWINRIGAGVAGIYAIGILFIKTIFGAIGRILS